MTSLLLCCLFGADSASLDADVRPLYELRRAMSEVMQEEAGAKTNSERAAAIHKMAELYLELKRDPRRHTSDTLREYKAVLWSRLTRIQRELERRFGKSNQPPTQSLGSAESLTTSKSLAANLDLAAQSLGGPMALVGQARSAAGARGGAAGPPDFGPTLVDLIERTISPDFWDTNGGPGSIVYFRAFHCLVVRASGEVHGEIGGLLGKLK